MRSDRGAVERLKELYHEAKAKRSDCCSEGDYYAGIVGGMDKYMKLAGIPSLEEMDSGFVPKQTVFLKQDEEYIRAVNRRNENLKENLELDYYAGFIDGMDACAGAFASRIKTKRKRLVRVG